MKDMLTTTSSIIVILFCLTALFLSDEAEPALNHPGMITKPESSMNSTKYPLAKTTYFHHVLSVSVQKGVLQFVTQGKTGRMEHFFLIRDKNVILIKKSAVDMPKDSIKFDDDGHNTLLVTIPTTFEIDLMHDLTATTL